MTQLDRLSMGNRSQLTFSSLTFIGISERRLRKRGRAEEGTGVEGVVWTLERNADRLQSGAADRSLGFEDEDLGSSPAGGPLL